MRILGVQIFEPINKFFRHATISVGELSTSGVSSMSETEYGRPLQMQLPCLMANLLSHLQLRQLTPQRRHERGRAVVWAEHPEMDLEHAGDLALLHD
jgi:hypothetical protein